MPDEKPGPGVIEYQQAMQAIAGGSPPKAVGTVLLKFDPKDVELLQAVSDKLDRLLEKLNA